MIARNKQKLAVGQNVVHEIVSTGEIEIGLDRLVVHVAADGTRFIGGESIGVARAILARKDKTTTTLQEFMKGKGVPSAAIPTQHGVQ